MKKLFAPLFLLALSASPAVAQPPGDQMAASAGFKVYENYDFISGSKILFEDDFHDAQTGEFPEHWELKGGQAAVKRMNAQPAFFLTDGNYAEVTPRMKQEKYLTDSFTVELDYDCFKPMDSGPAAGMVLEFRFYDPEQGFNRTSTLIFDPIQATFAGAKGVSLSKPYPAAVGGVDKFCNQWHHLAVAVKNRQMKVYVDQYRVLVIPDTKEDYFSMIFAGIGDEKLPVIFSNVRVATGGGMNMIGKKFTDSKIVTHGIHFDYDKAIILAESMGTLNMIAQLMKEDASLKFEIGGHTDGDGDATYNLKLSQLRAEAVRTQLIGMGIAAARLTAKGYGKTKPISDNTTPEGKANNRRVEFVKL